MLKIENLHAEIDGKPILKGLTLEVGAGEVHAIMGPNGAGKSTLGYVLGGRPGYEVTEGSVTFDGVDLLELEPNERAAAGLFLGFQYPVEIPGVSNVQFLRESLNAQRGQRDEKPLSGGEFLKLARAQADGLGLNQDMLKRPVNVGFSGGEKKRNEMVQMGILNPKFAILDETDSGLDIDALRIVGDGINRIMRAPDKAVLLITHYQRLLDYVQPDRVHVLATAASCARAAPNSRSSWSVKAMQASRKRRRDDHAGTSLHARGGLALGRYRCASPRGGERAGGAGRGADRFLDLPGARLLFVDGVLDESASDLGPVQLIQIDASDHPLGRQALGRGWSLRLERDAVADPVQIVHVASGAANHLPAEIVLAEDAAGQVYETYVGRGWTNRLTRVKLAASARLMRAVRLLQDDGFVSLREEAELGEGASLTATFLAAGTMGARIDGGITQIGDGAYAEFGGALLTKGELKQECAVALRHAALNGQSHQLWRAVAADRSQASLAARVEVARDAQKTDGEQSLRGLLLQRTATVNLKPELEIFADDVKCAHGATVGELDAKALFYMQSRAFSKPRAQALLTRAFVADAIDRIGNEVVREAFAADADAWLEAAL